MSFPMSLITGLAVQICTGEFKNGDGYFERRNIMEDLIEKIGAMLLILLMIAAGVLTVGAVCFIFSLFLPL